MNLIAGVIGCGYIANFHFPALAKAGVRVKWVCDISRSSAEPYLKSTGAEYTDDYRRILDDKDVQLVDVLTLSHLHKSMCLDAIEAEKNVICEKTLTTNAEDSFSVVQTAQEKEVLFYTAYMKRFHPVMVKAKALLPQLDRIVSTHVRTCHPLDKSTWLENPKEGGWHTPPGGVSGMKERLGGGILPTGGSHLLDLINYFYGRPNSVYSTMTIPKKRDYDLHVAAILQTDHGPVLYENLLHPLEHIGFLRDGWDERVEITGLDGRLEIYSAMWDKVTSHASLLVHYDNKTKQSVEYRFAPSSPFEPELETYCRNILNGVQGDPTKTAGYDVDELIAHMYKSNETGQAVDIQWKL